MNRPSMSVARPRPTPAAEAVSILLRVVLFSLLWWVMMEGRPGGLPVAAATVAAATIVSRLLWPPGEWRIHPLRLLAFIPWFLWNSLLAGVDVAWRAFHPKMPMHPEIIEIDLDGDEQSTILLAWTVSLIPGTACVRITPGRATLHVLDSRRPYRRKLEILRQRIAGLRPAH